MSWIAGATARLVSRMASGFWNGLRSMFTVSLNIAKAGFRGFLSLVGKGFEGLKALGKGVLYGFAAVLGATVVSIQKATERLRQAGNSISDIRGSTGLGSRAAGGIFRNFSAFGLSPSLSDTNPMAMQAQAQAWGLPGMGSRNFMSSLAGKYQSSDPYMRNYILQSMNIDSPEMRRRLMAPTSMLREQERFSGQVNKGLGIDPRTLEILAQRTELVGLKFKVLGEGVLLKLATTVLPRLLNVAEHVVNTLGANSDRIGEVIVAGVEKGFQALIRVGEFILRLPEMFFTLADSVLNFVEIAIKGIPLIWDLFLRGVAFVQSALGNLIGLAQSGFSHLTGLAEMMGASFVQVGEKILTVWGAVEGPVGELFDNIVDFLGKVVEAAPAIVQLLSVLGKVPKATGEMGQKIAEAMGGNESQGALGWLAGALAGGAMLKKAPGWLWNGGKALLGLGGGSAATNAAAGAATNPSMWAKIATSPVARYGGALARAVLNPTGLGFLFDIGSGAAVGAATAAPGAAAAGAARGGLMASGSTLLRNPLVQGTILGLVGYNDLQQRGWLPGNPASLGQMGQYAWDNTFGSWFGGGGANPSAPGGKSGNPNTGPGNWFMSMFGGMGGLAGSTAGFGGSLNPARMWQMGMPGMGGFNTNPASSSWSMALDANYGGSVDGLTAGALKQLNSLRSSLDEARGRYNADEQIRLLRELLGESKKQTPLLEDTAENISQANDRAAGYALYRYGKESGAALRRQS